MNNPSYGQEITFITHNVDNKVYTDATGQIRGKPHSGRRAFQVELIREMMTLMKHKNKTLLIYPFRRGLLWVQSKDNIALFNSARRPEREHTVKWVGPLQSDTIYLYEATQLPQKITTLEQAKKVAAICVLNGNAHDTYLTNNGFTNIYRAGHYEACFHMLIKGRVNFSVSTNTSILET